MAQPTTSLDFRSMSIPERILLVEEIWDSIAADQQSLEVTQAQKDELDRRLAACDAAPDQGSTWEEVKSRLRAKP
jgi:putative addiction module component (TIGR02574 family)